MSDRSFRCRACGELRIATTTTGPLPTTCAACDPVAAVRRSAARVKNLAAKRAQQQELARLRELFGAAERAPGGADRRTLARAVRAVGAARGREETRAALLHLRDVAQVWADQIGAAPAPTPPAAEEAAA